MQTLTLTGSVPMVPIISATNHPIEKVWRAITDETHRAAWFPELTLSHRTGGDAVVNYIQERLDDSA
jgi:uncharacterized protein YndB with AHSA1/START domain